jgi:uncharacterized 2Fe-2S/4Fe-4S cluster protein (DUF4445 family)
MVTCACSAGPAFEGMGITCGMPASIGAIEKIKIKDNKIMYEVIGKCKPKGICGSGIVDLLSELFINNIISKSGKFNLSIGKSNIIKTDSGLAYVVETAENTLNGLDILLNENDIQNLIRTKGAIYSACSLLLNKVGLTFEQINSFYIAGGFGKYLDIENSIRIGLFPDIKRNKFHYLGNTSLIGAYLIVMDDRNRELVNKTSEKMTYLELNTEPGYMHEYTSALFLPHTNLDLFPSVKNLIS